MTQLTQRQLSIRKIELLRSSIPYSGGDWKDTMAEFSHVLMSHSELPGITEEEYSAISQGDSCPRWASETLADLFEEIEGTVFPDKSEIRDAIAKTEQLLKALKLMQLSIDEPVDAFFTSSAFSLLDDSKIKYESVEYDADINGMLRVWRYEGDGSLTKPSRRLSITLELDIRQ